jgi:hypothetical protein
MLENSNSVSFLIQIEDRNDRDAVSLDDMTRNLLLEIERDLQPTSAALKSEVAPNTTRTQEAITIGAIALTLLPVFVDKLLDLLISWSERNDSPKVRLTIEGQRRSVVVEYDPENTSKETLAKLVRDAQKVVREKEH